MKAEEATKEAAAQQEAQAEPKQEEPAASQVPKKEATEAGGEESEKETGAKKEKPKKKYAVDETLQLAFRYFDKTGEDRLLSWCRGLASFNIRSGNKNM